MKGLWVVIAAVVLAAPVQAQTAKEVAEDMSDRQKHAWASGVTDMAARLFVRMGDKPRSECILGWQADSGFVGAVDAAMRANPTRRASFVMEHLIIRRCGAYR